MKRILSLLLLALALSAALLAAGTAGAVTLSGYDLYVKDDTAKGGGFKISAGQHEIDDLAQAQQFQASVAENQQA